MGLLMVSIAIKIMLWLFCSETYFLALLNDCAMMRRKSCYRHLVENFPSDVGGSVNNEECPCKAVSSLLWPGWDFPEQGCKNLARKP